MIGISPFHLQAIGVHLSSPACQHLHLNQQLTDNPNSLTPETLYLEIYDPRAGLPLHCRGERELRMFTQWFSLFTFGAGIQDG